MPHVHKYFRVDIGSKAPYIVYKCALPECNHYIPYKLVLGKLSICWRCGATFQLVKRLLLKKPHCVSCTNERPETKEKKEGLDEFLGEMGIE